MEICGTHTMSIARYGIPSLLPPNVELVSGPGCPVCVTDQGDIDLCIAIAKENGVTVATFGDMMKLKDSDGFSLSDARAEGADVTVVYSPMDILRTAKNNKHRKYVFLGVGFETTAPMSAALVKAAKNEKVGNLYLLSLAKTMPKVIELILSDRNIKIDGFLCPGNLSVVTGTGMFETMTKAGKAAVVSGFEAADILSSVLFIIRQINSGDFRVQNNYLRACSAQGNRTAQDMLKEVYTPSDVYWRGIGKVEGSGLELNSRYSDFNAGSVFTPAVPKTARRADCRCGDILKGYIKPTGCPLFSKACTPDNPFGACMVSSEGACAAYYKYGARIAGEADVIIRQKNTLRSAKSKQGIDSDKVFAGLEEKYGL
jgi:hydrogenase expression/formation protein HypD